MRVPPHRGAYPRVVCGMGHHRQWFDADVTGRQHEFETAAANSKEDISNVGDGYPSWVGTAQPSKFDTWQRIERWRDDIWAPWDRKKSANRQAGRSVPVCVRAVFCGVIPALGRATLRGFAVWFVTRSEMAVVEINHRAGRWRKQVVFARRGSQDSARRLERTAGARAVAAQCH
jgi:hypothetical protein